MRGVRVNERLFHAAALGWGNRFVSLHKAELTDIKREFRCLYYAKLQGCIYKDADWMIW